MHLDILFGSNSSDLDPTDEDIEVQDVEEAAGEAEEGIGWKVLALFICGGLVVTALVVAFMVWVIEGLVL